MFYLIKNKVVVGTSDFPQVPDGYLAVESNLSLGVRQVYYDGTNVLPVPSPPTQDHIWDQLAGQWFVPIQDIEFVPDNPNWQELEFTLRGSSFFNKAWRAAGESTRCNRNLMQLQMALSSTRNFQDFRFAFNAMRVDITALAMAATVPGFTDFTQSELDELSGILDGAGFDISEFNLLAD